MRLMDLTPMFHLVAGSASANEELGDTAGPTTNEDMFDRFNDMFQLVKKMAYVPLAMNGRQDTGLVLVHPSSPRQEKMILAFCFDDWPAPALLTGAEPST